jgi:hypothetical protein
MSGDTQPGKGQALYYRRVAAQIENHAHLCLSIPLKYSVANTVGFLKGKSAIRIQTALKHGSTASVSGMGYSHLYAGSSQLIFWLFCNHWIFT